MQPINCLARVTPHHTQHSVLHLEAHARSVNTRLHGARARYTKPQASLNSKNSDSGSGRWVANKEQFRFRLSSLCFLTSSRRYRAPHMRVFLPHGHQFIDLFIRSGGRSLVKTNTRQQRCGMNTRDGAERLGSSGPPPISTRRNRQLFGGAMPKDTAACVPCKLGDLHHDLKRPKHRR